MRYSSILLIALLLAGLGCNLNDSFDEEPMFIQVNSVDLVTVASQGEDTHATVSYTHLTLPTIRLV